MPVTVTASVVLPDDLLVEHFVRASGPGGQNVNKVATAVELRFDLGRSELADDVKARLRALAGTRLIEGDVVMIEAREHRTQAKNRDAARARLADLVRQALVRPRPRRKTKPTRAAKERRLESKTRRSIVKQGRRRGSDE